jgi:hypothetical protein
LAIENGPPFNVATWRIPGRIRNGASFGVSAGIDSLSSLSVKHYHSPRPNAGFFASSPQQQQQHELENYTMSFTSLHGKRAGLGDAGELIIDGRTISSAKDSPIWAGAPGLAVDPTYASVFFDDFLRPASATAGDGWNVLSDGSTGTDAFADIAGGVVNLVTAAADNDYKAWSSYAENWLFAAGKKLWLEACFRLTEAATDDSTWWFGLTDTLTTGGMQADTGGPLASYDGALIWKTPETALTVNFETSNAGTQNTLSAFATGVSGTWHRAGFYFDGTATISTITPYFHNGTSWVRGTAQNLTLSGLEEMHLVAGVKAGPGGNAETLQIDWIRVAQLR